MNIQIMSFIFYTLAMLGVIFIAYAVYKKVVLEPSGPNLSKLKVQDMLRLSPRKQLYVIKYENEKFLIASDVDSTTFLSKIGEVNNSDIIAQLLLEQAQNQPTLIERVENNVPSQIQIKEETLDEEFTPEPRTLKEKLNKIKYSSNVSNKNVMKNMLKGLNSTKGRY